MFEDERADERDNHSKDEHEELVPCGSAEGDVSPPVIWEDVPVGFDSGAGRCLLQGGAHSTTLEVVEQALNSEWETVIIARWEWEYIEFADSSGFQRRWSHTPALLEEIFRAATFGVNIQWCPEFGFMRLELEDMAMFVGLGEGTVTPCVRPVASSETTGDV